MHDFTWFGWISNFVNHGNIHLFSAGLISLVILILAFVYQLKLKTIEEELIPEAGFSFKNVIQSVVEFVLNLMEGIIGHDAKKYFPLIGALFIYIFLNNILGLIPGFLPATDNVNTNYACSIIVFLYYNYMGIKAHGLKNYLGHFMGPIIWLAPLMVVIELISHLVRPVSLGVRLFGNIYGDHVVLGIFSDLVPLVVPVIFLFLGLFVSFIQAFVFSLLSTVYIGLAAAHEEH